MSTKFTHPSGKRMRLAESLTQSIKNTRPNFTLSDWLASLSDKDINAIAQLTEKMTRDEISEEEQLHCDDITSCALLAWQEESKNAEPTLEVIAEAINTLGLGATLFKLERKGMVKVTSPLSILSDSPLSFEVTDEGLEAGLDPDGVKKPRKKRQPAATDPSKLN